MKSKSSVQSPEQRCSKLFKAFQSGRTKQFASKQEVLQRASSTLGSATSSSPWSCRVWLRCSQKRSWRFRRCDANLLPDSFSCVFLALPFPTQDISRHLWTSHFFLESLVRDRRATAISTFKKWIWMLGAFSHQPASQSGPRKNHLISCSF